MELLQLKYFQTVAYMEHISKAAKKLNISQPSLSLMIKRLEDEMGTPLFDRIGRNIQLNESGKIFLKHVNTIFSEIENAKMEIQENYDESHKKIMISITNPRFLSGVLTKYLNEFPDAYIQQSLESRESIIVQLKKGEIELGIAGPPIEDDSIKSSVLIEEEIVLVVPKNHHLSNREVIDLEEAELESFISLAGYEEYKDTVNQLYRTAGFKPKVVFEVDFSLLYEIFQINKCLGLIPITLCKKYNLNYVKISDPNARFVIGLSWLKDKHLSKNAKQFKDFILSYYNKNY
ncbi:LysR family transcriptional regulator [Lysinibacillus yapensis]|uniref:LysR family transcriptional regulator n=1 Tax=Ureibacillus yapensis TaxID=2304605 RepID=A0A396SCL1_9BACL|nr:LysR family transcriptional regulator [Lysinibacillus yapensis]RHW39360.1 LysR family transcriptional regulator [Lysinibacillus yapensis]